ncbi:MAG: efflux RND transporter permease subunit [Candidatus Eisenbacteria bacterium]
MNITNTSLRRPVTTFMVFACFIVIGVIASQMLPLEFLPDIDVPYVGIEIPYPGSTPEEIERRITRPAEEVLATISGIKKMESNTWESGTWIGIEFDWGINTDIKSLEAREKLEGIRHLFPDDLERFHVRKWSTTDMEMLQIRISSDRDLSDSYDMLNRNLKRRLERIEGIAKIDLYGVEKKEIQIRLSADRIISHRVDIGGLVEELRRSNFLVTAGKITDNNSRFVVRPVGELKDVDEIRNIVVGAAGVRLSDIADVTYDNPELTYGRHLDRRYAIGLDVFKEAGANTVEVAELVIAEIDEISRLPEMAGIRLFYLDNMAEGIVSSINELLKSGIMGGLLAMVLLFFFLRRFVTTLIVVMSVPFSLLIAMAFMYFIGVSLNILTMMGLMLAVGMLVDNAVVVTESIHRHQLVDPTPARAIPLGVSEVSLAITAGTLTTAIVFLPNIVSANDQIAIYIKHVAISLVIALGASLIMAQTIVPLLVSRVKPPRRDQSSAAVRRLTGHYRRLLEWSLRHRRATVGLVIVLLASVALPFQVVKKDMFDEPEDRRIRLHYHINGHYTVEKVENAVDTYEDYLFSHKDDFDVESVYSYYQGNYAMSTILLKKGKEASKSMDEIRDAIREGLPRLAIANPSFDHRDPTGDEQSVRVQLTGKSSEVLVDLSHDVAWVLSRVPGLDDVRSEAEVGEEEVHVVVDRDRARQYGFSTQEIANVVSAAMRGINLRPFQSEDGEVPMRLEFQEGDRRTLEHLQNLPLFNGENQPVMLASLADFSVSRGPQSIHRENRTTSLGVTANLDGLTVGEAKDKIAQALANFDMPAGYTWNYGESFDREEEAFNTMLVNLLLALALIYFVMASLFESLLFPAAIWSQILFAIVGVFWFFMITGTTMTIMAMIGILILIGVVVNNGIVLIDYVNQLRAKGVKRDEALVEAGGARLRPILMTAGTTILSLVPLCIVTTQIGGGGPPYFPMARAIVGGLGFSTVITLLVLPTIYVLLDDLRAWSARVIRTARS